MRIKYWSLLYHKKKRLINHKLKISFTMSHTLTLQFNSMNKKIRFENWLKTNKQTNQQRMESWNKQFKGKGKITFLIRVLQFHPNIWINPILEHELQLIILENWHVIDKNWCCRTYFKMFQVVSKKKKQQQRHTNKQGKFID